MMISLPEVMQIISLKKTMKAVSLSSLQPDLLSCSLSQMAGRFFGGGLTSEQKQIIQILDTDTNADTEDGGGLMTLPECRRTLLNLEKSINKNREMRVSLSRPLASFVAHFVCC